MAKLVFTDEQKKAINAMKFFLEYPVGQEFVLIGSAGTGKSTIIKEVILGRRRDTVLGVTISHAAKNVLNRLNGDYMQCETIAKAFGLVKEITAKGKEIFVPSIYKKVDRLIENISILIVDECSMIDDRTLKMIRKNVPKQTKIIYCGDMYQLPPVADHEDSQTFEIPNRAILTEPVRYDTIIGETAYYYRYLIEQCREFGGDAFDWNWLFDWMPKKRGKESRIEYMKDERLFLDRFLDYYAHDAKNTRILCFRNETIDRYNAKLRSIFFGNDEELYNVGEIIIMNKPYFKTDFPVHNGEMYEIKSVAIDSEKIEYRIANNRGDFDTYTKEIYFYLLNIRMVYVGIDDDDTGLKKKEKKKAVIKVIHPYSQQDADEIQFQLLTQAKNDKTLWPSYYNFVGLWADISYTYAMSTHKAQGQTLTNVLVNAVDIINVDPYRVDVRTKLQSLYVAVTRAQTNLTVLLDKSKITI